MSSNPLSKVYSDKALAPGDPLQEPQSKKLNFKQGSLLKSSAMFSKNNLNFITDEASNLKSHPGQYVPFGKPPSGYHRTDKVETKSSFQETTRKTSQSLLSKHHEVSVSHQFSIVKEKEVGREASLEQRQNKTEERDRFAKLERGFRNRDERTSSFMSKSYRSNSSSKNMTSDYIKKILDQRLHSRTQNSRNEVTHPKFSSSLSRQAQRNLENRTMKDSSNLREGQEGQKSQKKFDSSVPISLKKNPKEEEEIEETNNTKNFSLIKDKNELRPARASLLSRDSQMLSRTQSFSKNDCLTYKPDSNPTRFQRVGEESPALRRNHSRDEKSPAAVWLENLGISKGSSHLKSLSSSEKKSIAQNKFETDSMKWNKAPSFITDDFKNHPEPFIGKRDLQGQREADKIASQILNRMTTYNGEEIYSQSSSHGMNIPQRGFNSLDKRGLGGIPKPQISSYTNKIHSSLMNKINSHDNLELKQPPENQTGKGNVPFTDFINMEKTALCEMLSQALWTKDSLLTENEALKKELQEKADSKRRASETNSLTSPVRTPLLPHSQSNKMFLSVDAEDLNLSQARQMAGLKDVSGPPNITSFQKKPPSEQSKELTDWKALSINYKAQIEKLTRQLEQSKINNRKRLAALERNLAEKTSELELYQNKLQSWNQMISGIVNDDLNSLSFVEEPVKKDKTDANSSLNKESSETLLRQVEDFIETSVVNIRLKSAAVNPVASGSPGAIRYSAVLTCTDPGSSSRAIPFPETPKFLFMNGASPQSVSNVIFDYEGLAVGNLSHRNSGQGLWLTKADQEISFLTGLPRTKQEANQSPSSNPNSSNSPVNREKPESRQKSGFFNEEQQKGKEPVSQISCDQNKRDWEAGSSFDGLDTNEEVEVIGRKGWQDEQDCERDCVGGSRERLTEGEPSREVNVEGFKDI